MLRHELVSEEIRSVLALTTEQQAKFDNWSQARLTALEQQFDIDTTTSQKRMSWGMRIASTIGALAICAAIVLCFTRYWRYLTTPVQLAIVIAAPLLSQGAAELAAERERTPYFTGLLSLAALASFVLNLSVVGSIFNIVSTERALLAWGLLALLLAYRHRLSLMLAIGLLLLMSYTAAAYYAGMGYHWLDFGRRPEHFLLLGCLVFSVLFFQPFRQQTGFAVVYRLVGALTVFVALLSLAEWGIPSYLPCTTVNIERCYEVAGLLISTAAMWWGIARNWNELVNSGVPFFILFLFMRLYHWWWDWLPHYLFFAIIGAIGIALVVAFRRMRGSISLARQAAI